MGLAGIFDYVTIGSSAARLGLQTTTLNDAQIKALPTTPITVLSAQGSSSFAWPLYVFLWAKTTGGAYTNIDSAAYLGFHYATSAYEPLSWIPNDAVIPTTNFTSLLGGAANSTAFVLPGMRSENVNDWGLLGPVLTTSSVTNLALQILIGNGGSGNLTGGNAANSLVVDVYYVVRSVP